MTSNTFKIFKWIGTIEMLFTTLKKKSLQEEKHMRTAPQGSLGW